MPWPAAALFVAHAVIPDARARSGEWIPPPRRRASLAKVPSTRNHRSAHRSTRGYVILLTR